ncbi:UDP-N-acetylmuramoyl-tripeptide--D-alanyl-D-alanine ligase [Robertmurraya andreesenii]|uniref:UDP-N-acetylmuramoyl-tripeptide--D-alanyl-D-alanine ligase n=1 Tax=Anoxybacillus andreesenii TaxID=1325932 RepID=A0ABT9VAC4_9BACL|nr:UDP-N-acetylmuramoyl-tripeptide--D-alanyl-D-alanine ligase [Robertmurraya andreesenii]MDQ0157913.1 UDP-N-acetylmuramoyl-tripeptide--D-alanyl-D-alanine ligase [Robertmurraya andreesenii]
MKTLLLENILTALNLQPNEKQKGKKIKMVTKDRSEIKNHTLYFHWHDRKVPVDRIKNYKDVFIVTEKPFANMNKLKPEQIIMVKDLEESFFTFTSYYRHLFNIPVVAITGTCGKSTTKEMLKHILEEKYNVQATQSSKNGGYYHLPYLMGIDENTDVAVFETAVANMGHMTEACKYFYPTIGIITMIDVDHTDRFRSFDDYLSEKAKIMEGMNNEGTLILNIDDPSLRSLDTSKFKGTIITFGKRKDADFKIKKCQQYSSGMTFWIKYKQSEFKGYIPGLGEHNVYNAVTSLAAAAILGIDLHYALKRLSSFHHMRSHFEIFEGRNQITVVDDTWKSNPASLRKGLETLSSIASPNQRKIAVLGRMAALGKYANEEYEKAGHLLGNLGFDVLITKGSVAKDFAKPAIEAGINPDNVYHFSNVDEMKRFFDSFLIPNDIIYFKSGGQGEKDRDIDDVIDYLRS